MSFSYDLETEVGLIRLEIGDVTEDVGVRPDGTNFSDEEIEALLADEGDVVGRCAARCCEILARMYARYVDVRAGPRSESLSQAAEAWAAQAAALRDQYGYGSATALAGILTYERDDGFAQAAEDDDDA